MASHTSTWPMWLTLAVVAGYLIKQWLAPARATRLHDQMRRDWLDAVSAAPGSEVLGVQTIRNSLMSCTMTATTATLAFMGGMSLLYSRWGAQLEGHGTAPFQQHVLAVLVLLGLSFITSMLSARQWHHAGFVAGMPVHSACRTQWLPVGQRCVQRAGHYYALSVRLLMWCVPLLLVGVNAWAGLLAALLLLLVLSLGIDR